MKYKKIITIILDSFGVNRSYAGYNYVVHGLLLIFDNPEYLECITKNLYPDIAAYYHTSWNCVEKNIRTVVAIIWKSSNTELLELIFNKSHQTKKPANKEIFKYLYDYIMKIGNCVNNMEHSSVPAVCPISNKYCEALSQFYAYCTLSD